MIDFYIVKGTNQEPFYKASDDICFCDLKEARENIDTYAKQNEDTIDSYYIMRVEAIDRKEILGCFYAAGNGQTSRITKYKVLEIISIKTADQ